VISLIASDGRTLARTITNAQGQYRLSGSGAARLHAIRIGFRPIDSTLTATVANAHVTIDLTMTTVPAVLEAVQVHDQSMCPSRDDRPEAFALWEQARAALLASVVAREANPPSVRVLLYDRTLDRTGARVQQQLVVDSVFTASTPLASGRTAAEYESKGYANSDTTGEHRTYFAPDADVLLDSSFVRTHCLSRRADAADHPGQVGLAFTPAPSRKSLVDIDGVMWLDRSHWQLRSLEFKFTGNLERAALDAAAGGSLSFADMPGGVALTQRWNLRLPVLARTDIRFRGGRATATAGIAALRDVGGEVAEASWPEGDVWRDTLPTLTGRVMGDDGHPIAGVYVHLRGTSFDTQSDSTGAFRIVSILPGPYVAEAIDTTFGEFATASTTTVDLRRDAPTAAAITMPSRVKHIQSLCEDAHASDAGATGRALVLGRVLVGATAATDATVNVRWPSPSASGGVLRFVGRTDSTGTFAICGAPQNIPITVSAARDSLVSAYATITLDSTALIARPTLTLARADVVGLPAFRRRRATVLASSGAPLSDAELLDVNTGRTIGRSTADGTLSLATLPEGPNMLRVRKPGFEQRPLVVDIKPTDTLPVTVTLRTVTELAAVKVTARSTNSTVESLGAVNNGILDRAKLGIGHFMLTDEFDKANGRPLNSLLTKLGMHMFRTRRGTAYLSGGHLTGTCPVSLYMNGMLMWANTRSFAGVEPPDLEIMMTADFAAAEYYASPAEVPSEYNATGSTSGCGVLLLWTRG